MWLRRAVDWLTLLDLPAPDDDPRFTGWPDDRITENEFIGLYARYTADRPGFHGPWPFLADRGHGQVHLTFTAPVRDLAEFVDAPWPAGVRSLCGVWRTNPIGGEPVDRDVPWERICARCRRSIDRDEYQQMIDARRRPL